MTAPDVEFKVREFILKNFVFDGKKSLDNDESLIGGGIMDSTGILELISFLEENFHIGFSDSELVADNFDSVKKIVTFVSKKLGNVGTVGEAVVG